MVEEMEFKMRNQLQEVSLGYLIGTHCVPVLISRGGRELFVLLVTVVIFPLT